VSATGILFEFSRPDRAGTYVGVLRRVVRGRRGVRHVVVQLAGGDPFASSRSASYRGERVRLAGRELELACAFVRGRLVPLLEFLA